ncbi:MAG: 2-oxoglutarate dehydrogenase complex dihydrolipoyllysine-residue succinyltransferase [Polyangiaceae bacterium]|nr:2-oxoglutarate dehydrogenase complex dihydrolipoyllysine-residue succinyltransferase [Polyangiaceae bacterium]
MTIELKVPEIGESVSEVLVAQWHKSVGDRIERDEPVATLESDKVTLELAAPGAGRLVEVRVVAGQTSSVGQVIGLIEQDERAETSTAQAPAPPGPTEPDEETARSSEATPSATANAAPRVGPAARRALREAGLGAEQVTATGPGGRVLKEDVERKARELARQAAPGRAQETEAAGEEEVVPMSPFRQTIAERLVQAQQNAALLTTFNEIDMSAVMALRGEVQQRFTEKHQVKLGLLSFFVKAAVEALKEFPAVNSEVRGQNIVYKNHYDIGIAVGSGRGLVVPVLRAAERLSFAEIEQTIGGFARRAQENTLELSELVGGTFTISNGGVYGSLMSTPIINPPQSGILGLHAIQERPVVRAGQIVACPMMYVALTYDHRVIDGREAVGFLKRVKECVEQPARILLET